MKLSYDELVVECMRKAEWHTAQKEHCKELPGAFGAHTGAAQAWREASSMFAALAQQAQPLTDEMIEEEVKRRSFGFMTVDPFSFGVGAKWARDRMAQQAQSLTDGPDYRCVMCDKPIAVACKDCTEYAYDAVGYPAAAPQPEPEDARCRCGADWTDGTGRCDNCGLRRTMTSE